MFQFHPSGQAFVTGSEDKTARLFDIRSDQQVALYQPPNKTSGFTSCGLTLSGRYLMCGSDDNNVHIWDTLKNQHNGRIFYVGQFDFLYTNISVCLGVLSGHENRVTSLTVAQSGIAVVTSSWDQHVRVWG